MPNLSIRGLDTGSLAELKARAAIENASVNSLVLRLIDQGLGRKRVKDVRQRHDDLDKLAGSWCADEGAAFERATAAFAAIDPQLWR